MEYKPQQYPKYKYHHAHAARVVQNYEEEEALGDDWADRPDLVRQPEAADETTEDAEPKRPKKPPKKAD